MTAFNLLKPDHRMWGIDLHDAILLMPKPRPAKSMPHFVFSELRGGIGTWAPAFSDTVLHVTNVKAESDDVLQRSTNIGPWIPHVLNNALVPLIMLDSKSRSTFGAGTVRAGNRPVAVAAGETWSLNLNCGDPLHLPTGFVSAPNTVRAGMTAGDLLAGRMEMWFHMAKSLFESKFFEWAFRRLLGRIFAFLMKNPYTRPTTKRVLKYFGQRFKQYSGTGGAVDKYFEVLFGDGVEPVQPGPAFWDEIADPYNDPRHRVFL